MCIYVKNPDEAGSARDMGAVEVEAFVTHLAVEAKVAAPTQNQALQALLFLYRQILEIELPWLENVTSASRPKRLPVVLSARRQGGKDPVTVLPAAIIATDPRASCEVV